jgi:ubiquitin thioesterase protein OTUB1
MAPIVNLQYGMTSDYSPWDQALGFDVNSSLMAIPNLMQDTSFGMGAPMSPMPSVSPTPASPFRMSPQQDMYQSPMPTHAPIPSIPVSPSPQMAQSAAPPPMTSLPSRSSDGPQIRLNPLVMKPNLSRSLPVTTPFKKSVLSSSHSRHRY